MIYEKIKEALYNGDCVTVHRCNSDGSIDNFLFFVTYIDVIRHDHEHLERDASAPETCWSFGWIDPAE